jgi:adenine-specific DNA-methyltransferase
VSANVQAGHATKSQFYEVVAPSGHRHSPPNGRCWAYTKEKIEKEIAANNVWFGKNGNSVPRLKKFLRDSKMGLTPHTIWTADEVGTTNQAKKELLRLFPDRPVFDTPKPETLIQRIIEIASDEGDLVLDSYLGSGTTAVVAHRLGRNYVCIEVGEHAVTHCAKRLRKLVGGKKTNGHSGADLLQADGFNFYRIV